MPLDREPFKVPADYSELNERFGSYIKQILPNTSFNRSPDFNFDDLHAFIWLKILEGKFLDRFQAYYANRQRLATEANFRNYLSRAVFNLNALYQRSAKQPSSQEAEAAAVSTFGDLATGIVARMGALNINTPVRECMAVDREWRTAITAFQARPDFSPQHTVLVSRVIESAEYRNYRKIVQDMRSVPFPLPLLDLEWWLIGYNSGKGIRINPDDWQLVYKFKRDLIESDGQNMRLRLTDGSTALIIKDAAVPMGHIGT